MENEAITSQLCSESFPQHPDTEKKLSSVASYDPENPWLCPSFDTAACLLRFPELDVELEFLTATVQTHDHLVTLPSSPSINVAARLLRFPALDVVSELLTPVVDGPRHRKRRFRRGKFHLRFYNRRAIKNMPATIEIAVNNTVTIVYKPRYYRIVY
ncbi:hypothetical protein NP233_g6216 [Leucocoprinus birnbaumii]|uniref:Uncharacterized protein n=1 Tax=Leucocoprinus birnbaumii TaxID=56174 RepID=A0AAD5VRE4_9AGAR|nr:hypothetical protein NP233_g6216 [Leucocoprinus birnbaumii]